MIRLPSLMIAPNGATKTKADHPALPITLAEVTETARACFAAGADGLHLHLRDGDGRHLLDSGAYREAVTHLRREVPGMEVQITTEAAEIYQPAHQRFVALNSGATLVSVALREMLRDAPEAAARFYQDCADAGIAVQHILYARDDAEALARVLPEAMLRDPDLQLLFVLGRYSAGQNSTTDMMTPFAAWMQEAQLTPDWAVCAFGRGETACLAAAHAQGGKLRVGFENSLTDDAGVMAPDNAARVRAISAQLTAE